MEENTGCIFCAIANGEVPSVKVWEDDDFLAILDSSPLANGMTLVLPKKHFQSNVFDMPKVEYKSFMLATKRVAKFVERGLRCDRVLMVMEGLEVDHAHIKLYPYFNNDNSFPSLGIGSGAKKSAEELQKIADLIKKNNV